MTKAILSLVVLVAAVAAGVYVGVKNPDLLNFTNKPADRQPISTEVDKVVAQGRLVPLGGTLNVAAAPGDRIEHLLVQEGSKVVGGQTELAVVASGNLLEIQSRLATAQKKDAILEIDQKVSAAEIAERAAKLQLSTAELKLKQIRDNKDQAIAERQIANAEIKLNRLKKLAASADTAKLVSNQEIADQQLALDQAKDQLRLGKEELARAEETAQLAFEAATANVESAAKTLADAVAAARAAKDDTGSLAIAEELAAARFLASKIVAPRNGTVLKVFVKPGESIVNTPLLQIGDLSQMECVAEVYQLNLESVKLGQRVALKSQALNRELHGTVSKIGQLIGNATLPNPNPLALADKRTAEVRVMLDAADVEYAKKFINLQVTVEIELGSTEKQN